MLPAGRPPGAPGTFAPVGCPVRRWIVAAHAAALAAGDAGYPPPATGLFVPSAGFLARHRARSGRGCRHCPYVDD
ncbi:DUF5522 domain-containing protein [Micromonospora chersina]|uniref:DUF5522 domain-containing protein n=1 Tax=Micromonospora chersina TaxID=47854 RepID=UPI003791F223